MNLQEIYDNKKKIINKGYMKFYNTLKLDLENDEDFTLADDEMAELIIDLMLCNVIGEMTTLDEVIELLKHKNDGQQYKCSECGYTEYWDLKMVAEKGEPICPQCDLDMKLIK